MREKGMVKELIKAWPYELVKLSFAYSLKKDKKPIIKQMQFLFKRLAMTNCCKSPDNHIFVDYSKYDWNYIFENTICQILDCKVEIECRRCREKHYMCSDICTDCESLEKKFKE